MKALCSILLGFCCLTAWGSEVIPAKPDNHFNDYANVVPSSTAVQLNQRLVDFERSTSSQVLVAIYPKMQSDSSIEDYTVRVAQSWKVGQKNTNNGAVLFVFIQDRKMFLQVAYGLEGVMPDALCKQIIENEIKPRFKVGDYAGGLSAGVDAILAATKGEYKGNGQTFAERLGMSQNDLHAWLHAFIVVAIIIVILASIKFPPSKTGWGGIVMGSRGYYGLGSGWLNGPGFRGGWGGGGGGFGGGGGGGGTFSGGGGSFGGGGAGGSW